MRITFVLAFAGLMAFLGSPSHAQTVQNYQKFQKDTRMMMFMDAYDRVLTPAESTNINPILVQCAQQRSIESIFQTVDDFMMHYTIDVNELVRPKLYHAVIGVCMQH